MARQWNISALIVGFHCVGPTSGSAAEPCPVDGQAVFNFRKVTDFRHVGK